ncbi:hypothetical protein NP233_g11952 [Leucocoprinus birnbaumii]|uniref:Protein kinase domain-containing protein n=1 Tax=Leucocoprinus birnbaumii TaxID=56174 RepID=A0AAD5YQF2_9AGAR|nr:hypothetical protein NP233_g11952 [Leucocoprinus birnbaumii]
MEESSPPPRFTCPGDADPIWPGHQGWTTWFHSVNAPDLERPAVDFLPDLSSYSPSERYPVPGLTNSLNEQICLFSSRNPTTVQRHFHWMAEHGVAGAFVHRSCRDILPGREKFRDLRDEVLDHICAAAEKEGRVFAIYYDMSDITAPSLLESLERDWTHLIQKGILESPSYLRQNGSPVLMLKGMWEYNRTTRTKQLKSLLHVVDPLDSGLSGSLIKSLTAMLRRRVPQGLYIVGMIDGSLVGMAEQEPELTDVRLGEYDAVVTALIPSHTMSVDNDFLKKWLAVRGAPKSIEHIVAVFPGVSNHNSYNGGPGSVSLKRNGGQTLWTQLHNASNAGIRTVIGFSWDNFPNGSALLPTVFSKGLLPQSDKVLPPTEEDGPDLPSDWYMRICGLAAKALQERRTLPETLPQAELEDYWIVTPRLGTNSAAASSIACDTSATLPLPLHKDCVTLLLDILGEEKSVRKYWVAANLEHRDAQLLSNFLSKVRDSTFLPMTHKNMERMLHLLSHLAQSFNVFPASYELKGINCDLNKPQQEGGFGYVCKAIHNGQLVCVKAIRMYERPTSAQHLKGLSKELILWAHLDHPNVVPFYGVWIPKGPLFRTCVVSPWMENGNLTEYLTRFPETASRLLLLSDVGHGLDFLHRSGIIHADLKGANVLVSSTGQAMLTDFGASHIAMTMPTTVMASAITPQWAAPELLSTDQMIHTQASDIWAFGCVIYEVVSGRAPFYNLKSALQVLIALTRGNTDPVKSDPERDALQLDERLAALMSRCWEYDEHSRPTSGDVVQLFRDLKVSDKRPLPRVDKTALTASHRAASHIEIDYGRLYEILKRTRETLVQGSVDDIQMEN